MVSSVPEGITQIVMTIYSTCSVDLFQQMIQALANDDRITRVEYVPEEVCGIAEHNYCSLNATGNWDGVSPKAMISEEKPS